MCERLQLVLKLLAKEMVMKGRHRRMVHLEFIVVYYTNFVSIAIVVCALVEAFRFEY